ncbi:piggyBac transposable element-derived protein 4 [Trichonephila clavipes]|nr:piggyBac transposable element-derived protein 4 [Trichonephila clavipes]
MNPKRKDLPQMLKAYVQLERGGSMFLTKKGAAAVKWMDNKTVTMLSTAHIPEIMTSVNWIKKKDGTKEIPCPKAVAVCKDVMGGVEHFDQRSM